MLPSLRSPSLLLPQACLQLFQALPKDVAPLVWSTEGKSEALQNLLGLLLEVAWGKVRMAPERNGASCPRQPQHLGCLRDPA